MTAKRKSDLLIRSMISNSNWTEWSTIQRVLNRARVISKSDQREAGG